MKTFFGLKKFIHQKAMWILQFGTEGKGFSFRENLSRNSSFQGRFLGSFYHVTTTFTKVHTNITFWLSFKIDLESQSQVLACLEQAGNRTYNTTNITTWTLNIEQPNPLHCTAFTKEKFTTQHNTQQHTLNCQSRSISWVQDQDHLINICSKQD